MENVSELSLKYLANAVRRRWGIALLVAAPLFAAGVVYIFSLTPAYTSTAVVLLAPAAEELTDASSGRAGAMTDPFFIRSETTIIGSDGLSRAVVEKLKLWDDPEFQPQPGVLDRLGWRTQKNENGVLSKQESLEDSAVRYYQDNLSVSNDGRSKTVAISYTAADPAWRPPLRTRMPKSTCWSNPPVEWGRSSRRSTGWRMKWTRARPRFRTLTPRCSDISSRTES